MENIKKYYNKIESIEYLVDNEISYADVNVHYYILKYIKEIIKGKTKKYTKYELNKFVKKANFKYNMNK